MADSYTIIIKGEVRYKNLTQEEYFEYMDDLSIEYYQTGRPRPSDIETKNYRRLQMAMRSKVGVVKDGFMPGKPKKSRQGQGKNTKYAATSRNNKKKVYRGQGK